MKTKNNSLILHLSRCEKNYCEVFRDCAPCVKWREMLLNCKNNNYKRKFTLREGSTDVAFFMARRHTVETCQECGERHRMVIEANLPWPTRIITDWCSVCMRKTRTETKVIEVVKKKNAQVKRSLGSMLHRLIRFEIGEADGPFPCDVCGDETFSIWIPPEIAAIEDHVTRVHTAIRKGKYLCETHKPNKENTERK